MPSGDRTGPRSGGPKTGRGLGYCKDSDQSDYAALQPAQRLRMGYRWGGRGRGRRNRFNASFWPGRERVAYVISSETQDQDIGSLKAQADELQNALQEIQARLTDLESEDE